MQDGGLETQSRGTLYPPQCPPTVPSWIDTVQSVIFLGGGSPGAEATTQLV